MTSQRRRSEVGARLSGGAAVRLIERLAQQLKAFRDVFLSRRRYGNSEMLLATQGLEGGLRDQIVLKILQLPPAGSVKIAVAQPILLTSNALSSDWVIGALQNSKASRN